MNKPGHTLSHYRLIEKIGEGGMGVVWKAEDTVLGRTVAIKVLPADHARDEKRRKMFFDEARLASSVSEAHIVQVYEFGHEGDLDFIVMEYVEGKPLNKVLHGKPMPPERVAEIGHQVARALSKAHRKGLLHRDLKPANILITPDGDAKVVDFGLATLFTPQEITIGTAGPTQTITEGLADRQKGVVGTIPYMSPEQVRGEKLDARSDIFSLGSVLYEMTTGQRPFKGATSKDVVGEILKSRPKPVHVVVPKVPLDLDKIITKSLSHRRGDRYQNSEDLAVDLKRLGKDLESGSSPSYEELGKPIKGKRRLKLLGATLIGALLLVVGYSARHLLIPRTTPPYGKTMLAVLPFENLSGDPEQEYFSDGMTEEMIAQLGPLHPQRLGVIARTSVMRYKNTDKGIDQIGRELGVDYILEGSVRREADRVRITAQLIQVSDQTHLWAESYERELAGIFAIQSDVSRRIADSLTVELVPAQQKALTQAPTVSLEAHEAYLKGRYYWNKRTGEGLKRAIEYFEQAIEKDPGYALAYTGLADSYSLLPGYGNTLSVEAFPKARKMATKAIQIDDTLAEAHASLANVKMFYDWDWPSVERFFRNAIELNPNYATGHHWYSYYLGIKGRHSEAIGEAKQALRLDPLSLIINENVGFQLSLAQKYQQAVEQLRMTLELDPNFGVAHWALANAYVQMGRYKEAIKEYRVAISLFGGSLRIAGELGHVYAVSGMRKEAWEELDKLLQNPKGPALQIALIFTALGETDKAFEWLEKAFEVRDSFLLEISVEPRFENLRSDPRFQDLLRRMNFPE